MVIYFFAWILYALIFGCITQNVAKSKGYEGGFAWGFLLGVIGLLVVGFKPENKITENEEVSNDDAWICWKCKTKNPNTAKFCGSCGESRRYKWKCSKCKSENGEDVVFCQNCGKGRDSTDEEIKEPPKPVYRDVPFDPNAQTTYTVKGDQVICDRCLQENDIDRVKTDGFCWRCGAKYIRK